MRVEEQNFKHYNHADKMKRGFHFTIDTEGRWTCHDPDMGEGPIKRDKIAALFAGAGAGFFAGKGLSKDEKGRYWLKAPPNDVYGVDVEDVPFTVTEFENLNGKLVLITNFGERISAADHEFKYHREGIFPDTPYVEVRSGLEARLSRNVYYQLAELGYFV